MAFSRYGIYVGAVVFLLLLYANIRDRLSGFSSSGTSTSIPAVWKGPTPEGCAVSPNATLRIMSVGDSLTEGFGSSDYNGYRLALYDYLQKDCAGREVEFVGTQRSGKPPSPSIKVTESEGYSGYDIERILNISAPNIDKILSSRDPSVVLLHIGTNNMSPLRPPDIVPPEHAPMVLERLIDHILSLAPHITLIVAKIITSPNFVWIENTPVYNAAIPGIVKRKFEAGYKVLVADLSSVGSECVRNWDGSDVDCEDLNGDGVHPKDAGYKKMAGFWYMSLVEATSRGFFEKGEGWKAAIPTPAVQRVNGGTG